MVGFLGDFDLAEEAVQEAFATAAERWPRDGTPANPGAWLTSTVLQNISIPEIRDRLSGQVIAPRTPSTIGRARSYATFDRRPAVIIRPSDAEEVAFVVSLARENGAELAVRSGGHSTAGHSVSEGGIVLDLSLLKALEIDPEGRTAWAETGLTTGEVTGAAAAHGLAVGFGDTGSVGIGGLTLGGGVGYLSRLRGLTIDNLLAAEVVTADDRLLRADENQNQDLFWAIRGGGGNFGVATRFLYRLQPLDTVVGGMLMLPATPELIASFVELAGEAPEELSAIINIMAAPPMPFVPEEHHGELIVMALVVYAGPIEDGEKVLAPFRALATPIADMLKPMPYPQMFAGEEEFRPLAVGRTLFLDTVDRDVAESILDRIRASSAMMPLPSSACWAERSPACPTTPPRSRTGRGGS